MSIFTNNNDFCTVNLKWEIIINAVKNEFITISHFRLTVQTLNK